MSSFYDSTAWRRFRAQTLRQRPLCQVDGCGQASCHLDHRVPIRAGGAALDPANVQALCASCHSRKTALSDGGYRCRFGSLIRAYTLVGYTPDRDFRYIEINRRLRELHPRIVAQVVAAMQRLGGTIRRDPKTDLLIVNDEFTVSLVIARCLTTEAGHSRWAIRLDTGLYPDLTVAVRMAEGNDDILDYYLLPSIDITVGKLRLAHDNGVGLDAYRFESLDYLFGMAERVHLREAA